MGLIHIRKYHTSSLNHEEKMQSINLHETGCKDKILNDDAEQSLDAKENSSGCQVPNSDQVDD